jgi:outer membrane immunogenic protein
MRSRMIGLLLAVGTFGLGNAALAADMPVRAPVYKAPPMVQSWTGWYAGVVGGYATGPTDIVATGVLADLGVEPINFDVKGGFVGGKIGYDHQLANGTIIGVVADMAWAHLKGQACAETNGCDGTPEDSYAKGTIKWLATVRGKLGVAIGPDTQVYATGGLALARAQGVTTFIDGTNDVTAEETHVGWAVGVGGEYRLTRELSFGLEYLYADLGNKDYNFNSSNLLGQQLNGQTIGFNADLKLNMFRAALNYRF